MDTDDEDDGIDGYVRKANGNNKRPLLQDANVVLSGSKVTKADQSDSCNSIYSDLAELKKIFGRYVLFEGCEFNGRLVTDSSEWIELVESYLVQKYANPAGIVQHFFGFLDQTMIDWYFALDLTKFKVFDDFKCEFLKEAKRLEFEMTSAVTLAKDPFLVHFKKTSGSDKKNKLADQYPLTTYFVEKCNLIRLVFPNSFRCSNPEMFDLVDRELSSLVLSQIGDQTLYEKFIRFKSDRNTLLSYLKHQDLANAKGTN